MRPKDLLAPATAGAVIGTAAGLAGLGPSLAVFLAALSCFVTAWPLWLFRRLQEQAEHTRRRLQKDARAWAQLTLRLDRHALPLPELGGIRVSPDFAAHLLEIIDARRPRILAEFGCGASTILAAAALRRIGAGKIHSFDHDVNFAAETRAELERRGLSSWAEVTHAPLQPGVENPLRRTYDPQSLAALPSVDMVVIDGPPSWEPDVHRGEVLYTLSHRLAPGARVLFDDGDREEISRFITEWTTRHPGWNATRLDFEKGAWILCAPEPPSPPRPV